ncbi:MAG TPA: hypothetical protein VK983_05625 [Candidatus Limnocylindrales bacterium]|nr:hypothetical protein [Candidatus Limnocylindrales bacterium]
MTSDESFFKLPTEVEASTDPCIETFKELYWTEWTVGLADFQPEEVINRRAVVSNHIGEHNPNTLPHALASYVLEVFDPETFEARKNQNTLDHLNRILRDYFGAT